MSTTFCAQENLSVSMRDRLATGFTNREETTVMEKTQNEKKNKRLKKKNTMAHSIHTISIKKYLNMNWLVCPQTVLLTGLG